MSFVRRSFAALSGVLILQLLLLGSGTLSVMHHGRAQTVATKHAMTMAGSRAELSSHASAVSNADESHTPMSPAGCNGGVDHDACRLPIAPGQCSFMTACDVSATPAAAIWIALSVPPATVELPSPALAPSGPTFAPELPPPRA